MALPLQKTEIYQHLNNSNNPGYQYITDERLLRDVWNIEEDLPSHKEAARIRSIKNIYFQDFSLSWLKDLVKFAILVATGSKRWGLSRILGVLVVTKKFDAWLVNKGYVTPSALQLDIVEFWRQEATYVTREMQGFLNLLHELGCINFRVIWKDKRQSKPPTIIPEEVKHKLDIAIAQLDRPIFLLYKLNAALGLRSCEIAKIPLDCLRRRNGVARIRLCTAKLNDISQEQDLPEELVALVEEQQAFVRMKFGDDFSWLFPHWKIQRAEFQKISFPPNFAYFPMQMKKGGDKMNRLLQIMIEKNNIRKPDGTLAHVTTHMYRRTFATVADRMGKRPDLIQHALRHANPDMQDAYVNVSPRKQEKRIARVLVDKDGKQTTYKTNLDSEILKREWNMRQVELGLCTRPNIVHECEFEHVCMNCEYSRYSVEHLPSLLEAENRNISLLNRAEESGQADSRRANSARQNIKLLNTIISSLQKEIKKS